MKKFVTTLIAACTLCALPLAACNKKPAEHVHAFGAWRAVTQPDCTHEGLRERECDCGEKESEPLAVLGHDWKDGHDGEEHWQECTRTGCGEEKDREAHTYGADDKCTVCGYEQQYTLSLLFEEIYGDDETTVVSYAVAGLEEGAADTEIVIPAVHNGKPVTEIAEAAFSETDIESVVIADNIKIINNDAFYNCANLNKVKFGKSVEIIGDYAFNSTAITELETPASVKTIGRSVFYNCNVLKTAKILGAETIGKYLFYADAALESVEFGENVTVQFEEKTYALAKCPSLKTLIINCNVAFEGYTLYDVAEASVDVIFGDNLTEIQANALYPKWWSTDFGSVIKSITIGKNVKKIGDDAFYFCDNVKTLVLPEGLEETGVRALCMLGIEELTIPKSCKKFQGGMTYPALKRVNYGGTVNDWAKIEAVETPLQNNADFYADGKLVTEVVITEVEAVPRQSFRKCNITRVTLGESVARVEQEAFSGNKISRVVILNKECRLMYEAFGSITDDCEIYYNGTPEEMLEKFYNWGKKYFPGKVHYFYSETGEEPAYTGASGWTYGGLWRYVDGQVTKW